MLPIGITCLHKTNTNQMQLSLDYLAAVEKAGGIPLPFTSVNIEAIKNYFKLIKGLVLSGGGDVDPFYYGEEPVAGHGEIFPERDWLELELARLALQKDLPVLGICRGAQVLCIALGGELYQDLKLKKGLLLEHMQKAPRHHPYHKVSVLGGTLLGQVLGEGKDFRVNSFHHQAIKRPGDELIIGAVAVDGVIEAVEAPGHTFILGVQWHPEALAAKGKPGGQELFDALLGAAARQKAI